MGLRQLVYERASRKLVNLYYIKGPFPAFNNKN